MVYIQYILGYGITVQPLGEKLDEYDYDYKEWMALYDDCSNTARMDCCESEKYRLFFVINNTTKRGKSRFFVNPPYFLTPYMIEEMNKLHLKYCGIEMQETPKFKLYRSISV